MSLGTTGRDWGDPLKPGEVVICVRDDGARPLLKKGLLYRVQGQFPGHDAYTLEGVDLPAGVAGIWGSRFRRMRKAFTVSGPIRPAPPSSPRLKG